MALNLSYILRAVDRASAPTRQFVGALVGLRGVARSVPAPVRQVTAASDGQAASADRTAAASRRAGQGLGALTRYTASAGAGLQRVAAAGVSAGQGLDRQRVSADRARQPTLKLTRDLTALVAAAGLVIGASGVGDHIRTSAQAAIRPVVALTTAVGKLPAAIQKVRNAPGVADKIRSSAERAHQSAVRLAGGLGRIVGAGIGLSGLSFTALGGSVIKTASQFEKFGATLEVTMGSALKASSALNWVQKFAQTTPYELDKVLEAFVQLQAYGIDATDGSLRSLGNGASAMNKDLMQAVEMLADAQTGEFERLKEFGIRASQTGNKVAFTYSKAGKDITVTSTKSSAAIRKAVLGIFDARFQGAMDRQSKTFAGMWANMKDMATKFQLDIANAGLFDVIKGELGTLLAAVNAASANGSLQRWAGEISRALVSLFKALKTAATSIDWPAVISGIAGFISGAANFIKWAGGIGTVIDGVVILSIVRMAAAIISFAVPALGALGVAGAPIWLTVGAIAALAAGAYLIWRNWGPIKKWFGDLWAGILKGVHAFWEGAKKAFALGAQLLYGVLPPWMKLLIMGGRFVFNAVANVVKGRDDTAGQAGPRPPRAGGAPAPRPTAPVAAAPRATMAPARPTAAPARPVAAMGVGQRAQPVTGRIEVALSHDGPPRVRSVRTNQPDLALTMARGQMAAGG